MCLREGHSHFHRFLEQNTLYLYFNKGLIPSDSSVSYNTRNAVITPLLVITSIGQGYKELIRRKGVKTGAVATPWAKQGY